jgi:hypothetical protein
MNICCVCLCRFLNVSSVARNLTAYIPCHTEHCAVFMLPLHAAGNRSDETAATATASAAAVAEGGMETAALPPLLQDFRLIQPAARDNRGLSVLAGHFHYYSPWASLPQCSRSVSSSSSSSSSSISSSSSGGGDSAGASASAPSSSFSTSSFSKEKQQKWLLYADATEMSYLPHSATESDTNTDTIPSIPTCDVSCFVVGRHPVDRAISYYYQRFYKPPPAPAAAAGRPAELHHKTINELSAQELHTVALATREGMQSHFYPREQVFIDEGMSDAACSAVLGIRHTSGRRAQSGTMTIPPEIPAALYPRAIRNINTCVVGLQERWNETLQVLDHWYPWIDFTQQPHARRMSLYRGMETRATLRRDLYEVLVALNPCDMLLYEEMQRLFDKQLQVLQYSYF